jgi:hypothetical protein
MKKIALFFVLAITLISCSDEGNSAAYFLSYVDSVEMPDSYKVDSISVIKVSYKRPSDCHVYDGFFVKRDDNIRTVAIQFVRPDHQNDCLPDNTVFQMPLQFKPAASGTYLFKFWSGRTDGEDTYIEHEILVP